MQVKCTYCGHRFDERHYNENHIPCPEVRGDVQICAGRSAELPIGVQMHCIFDLETGVPVAEWDAALGYWVDFERGERLCHFDHVKP